MARSRSSRIARSAPASALAPRADVGVYAPSRDVCLELEDQSETVQPATRFFGLSARDRGAAALAARLTEQFLWHNQPLLQTLDVQIQRDFDGNDVYLRMRTGNTVGAVPLVSPTSAQSDYGLVIQPRFPWSGIGPMLAEMGWRVAPIPMRLPLLKRSERRVPPWVLSSMVLTRIRAMLADVQRRFEMVHEEVWAPKGRVDWGVYVTGSLARGQVSRVPCTYPELREDRRLLGAVRHTLELQLRSLETQRHHGVHVHRLIDFATQMVRGLLAVPAVVPNPREMAGWMRRPMRQLPLFEGIQAMQWTMEGRGLAGISDLDGIPWQMPMEGFFEAWVEAVLHQVAVRAGGVLHVGRRGETRRELRWHPSYHHALRSLVPDFHLQVGETTLIVDAKYKRHWEEWHWGNWTRLEAEIHEQHRHDFHQILAYANLSRSERTVACLCYPCSLQTWERLVARDQVLSRTFVPSPQRNLEVWVTAIPMNADAELVARTFLPFL